MTDTLTERDDRERKEMEAASALFLKALYREASTLQGYR